MLASLSVWMSRWPEGSLPVSFLRTPRLLARGSMSGASEEAAVRPFTHEGSWCRLLKALRRRC